jgi:hypothetical protein
MYNILLVVLARYINFCHPTFHRFCFQVACALLCLSQDQMHVYHRLINFDRSEYLTHEPKRRQCSNSTEQQEHGKTD